MSVCAVKALLSRQYIHMGIRNIMFLIYKLHTLNFQKTKGFLKKFFGFFCAQFSAFGAILFVNLIMAALSVPTCRDCYRYCSLRDQ